MHRFAAASFILLSLVPTGIAAQSLPDGFGKAHWGMREEAFLEAYEITLSPPESAEASGYWAVHGPAPGELTVSGVALGDPEIRSASFGFHPDWGLTVIHLRLDDLTGSRDPEAIVQKWIGRYGSPLERRADPIVIWEDRTTHIELTFHVVSPRHPSPSDHYALVLWSIPFMDRIADEEGPQGHEIAPSDSEERQTPDPVDPHLPPLP